MRADASSAAPSCAAPSCTPMIRLLALVLAAALALPASRLLAAPPPPPPTPPAESTQPAPAPPAAVQPLPAYPDITSNFISKAILSTVMQNFTGKLKRHGRKIYLEEQSTSSGPVGYNEYFIYDLDNNMLYRFLRDEQVYFESTLSLDQRVDAIRKGWVPAEGVFAFRNIKATLSSKDIPLRPDVVDKRPVELNLREVTTEIPKIGAVPARTVKYYSFVWLDPTLKLPVKISYSVNFTNQIVEYHNIVEEKSDPSLFEIPKDYVDLTPY
jgi:hypothetical protein